MQLSKNKWLLTTGLALTVVGLSACGSSEMSSDGRVTIEYFNQKKEMSQTIQEIAKDFEAENPDIHVEVIDVPNAGEVIKTRMLAGDVPDVINLYPQSIELQEWAKAGYLEDLTDEPYLENIKNEYAQRFAVDGEVYNVPLSANVYGFYYNKTAFDEMGLEAPETWAEFQDLVADIEAQGQVPFAIAGSEGWTLNGYHQLALATVAGGEEEANDVWRFSEVNGISVDEPDMQGDFNRLDLLREAGALQNNWQGAGYNDTVVTFTKGDALIMPNGSWAMPMINSQDPDFEVATFPFPADEAGESLTIGAGDLAMSISATSEHKEEAQRFVEYMTTPEAMQKYYDVDGSPVAVEGVVENDEDSPLSGLTELAFTDRHLVWLAKDWNSENDFYTLTTNYLHNGNQQMMVDALNAFFNPMKADGR
ncbi:extracellular solute-binding protein [Enterococcus sp. HY326]|uniref:extracellular solute-binding protein n=1 Tax=Enterococcus sp. HY326 TaxID=2971265 RepID=UPI00223EA377|nr:extracellular solute-binding protein [Enterococcus sp. HY326]